MKNFTIITLLLFSLGITSVMAQGRTLSGKVTDEASGEPIIGATVLVQGTANGAYTMEGGQFTIANVEGAVTLEVTFMGYKDLIIPVSASQTNVNIELTLSAMTMDEIVVVAYGQADKKSLTGSVAVITSDKIEDRPLTNVSSAIAGMASGIQSTTASGIPGSTPSIRIRGIGSINSVSEPLYVVDGVPYSGDVSLISTDDIASMSILKDAASTALYGSRASNGVIMITTKSGQNQKVTFDVRITQGFMYRALPEYDKIGITDFYELGWESLRNSRHYTQGDSMSEANKTATDRAFNPNYNSWYNILQDQNGVLMNNAETIQPTPWEGYADQSWLKGSLNPNASVIDGYNGDLDWLEYASGIGYRQNYNISASGGTKMTSYFTSVGYTDEKGYFEHTTFTRLNARAKVDVTPTKWLKLGVNISTSFSDSEYPYGSNPWATARYMAPIYPVHMHDRFTGNYILDVAGNKQFDVGEVYPAGATGDDILITKRGGQTSPTNIFLYAQNDQRNSSTTYLNGQAYAAITFLKDFKFTIDAAINYGYTYSNNYVDPYKNNTAWGGKADNFAGRNLNNTFKQMLEWNKQFDKHSISAMIGHESFDSYMPGLSVSKYGEIFPGSAELDNFSTTSTIGGSSNTYRSEGYFGRANYNYDEKYYLSTSYRRDGSSRFSPQNRWGNFWSVGASWIISAEDFMANTMWIDFLKFRASYGTNGNDGGFNSRSGQTGVGYYAWRTTYGVIDYGGASALAFQSWTIGTPNLQWETAGALDIGFDFRFFNRLNGTLNYFEKSSDELIFQVPVPLSSGAKQELQNVGSMTNRGVELELDVDAIRKKDWVWNIGINLTWLQNRINDLPAVYRKDGIETGTQKLLAGHSIYEFYLPQYGGIDPQDGATYYHVDPELRSDSDFQIGDKWYTKLSSNAHKDFSGDAIAPVSGALTSSLSWKNLTLDVLFTFRIGGNALDYSHYNLMAANTGRAWSTDMLGSWRKPGDITSLPRMEAGNPNLYAMSSNTLIDNSYLALQNVTLAYEFPKKVANKLTLKGLSVYVSGENLVQFSGMQGYDAMSSFSGYVDDNRFGAVATVSFGINVSF